MSVSHAREPWNGTFPVYVHSRLDVLKGTDPALAEDAQALQRLYLAAKFEFDMDAAFDLIERCVSEEVLDRLADLILECQTPPRVIYPNPDFDDEDVEAVPDPVKGLTNAIPVAYAAFLSEKLGCPVDEEIFLTARVGRTKLRKWLRFLCQPSFTGAVRPAPYIIIDDVFTTGGTFAALRSHIVRWGGTSPGGSSLSHAQGSHQELPIAPRTLSMLISAYGEALEQFWLGTLGHEIECITEAEGVFLLGFAVNDCGALRGDERIHALRARLDKAASKSG